MPMRTVFAKAVIICCKRRRRLEDCRGRAAPTGISLGADPGDLSGKRSSGRSIGGMSGLWAIFDAIHVEL